MARIIKSRDGFRFLGILRLSLLFIASMLSLNPRAASVDFSTIEGKVLFGYQGWFNCPMNGSGTWTHWSGGAPTATSLHVELYPDLSEFKTQDLCAAGAMTIAGAPAYLFSSRSAKVVDTHFRWMEEYGLDGVFVQRFIGGAPGSRNSGDVVLKNIIAAAAAHGRTFAIEYDLTGGKESNFISEIQADWKYMVDVLKVTSHPNYLHQNGVPVVSIWGPGINDGGHVPAKAATLVSFIDWFHTGPTAYRAFYMGGTPNGWRTGTGDAYGGADWKQAFEAMDAIQPWTVGRYSDTTGVKNWGKNNILPDIIETKAKGRLFMPVAFPGFSWSNLKQNGRPNQIPRLGGKFLWSQAYQAKAAGAGMLKLAMFDEVDEGTAMFKVVADRKGAPDQGYWLTLDADGYKLPSDWYLRLASEITDMFHGSSPLTQTMPVNPKGPSTVATQLPNKNLPAFQMHKLGQEFIFDHLNLEIPDGNASIQIFNSNGKLIRSLAVMHGYARWDGHNSSGGFLPQGLYIVKVQNGQGTTVPIF
jgi:hypothetical protein